MKPVTTEKKKRVKRVKPPIMLPWMNKISPLSSVAGSDLTYTSMFCGCGGDTEAAATVEGIRPRQAMNHWDKALIAHNENHPNMDHHLADLSASGAPRRYPSTRLLWASPECTYHSNARGEKRATAQLSLLPNGEPDPSGERSRATMWDVPRFAEVHRYDGIIVENVVEIRKWPMWDAWLLAMQSLGYEHKALYLNSMFFHPTPQSRDRIYVVFWKKGAKAPMLDYRPSAFCAHCGHDVEARQTWRNGNKSGKYGMRNQYIYTCPTCRQMVTPYYYCAYNAIDWSLPATRIGDRAKPLKEMTMRRIQVGIDKYVVPFLMAMKDSAARDWAVPMSDPLTTIVASASQHSVITPPAYWVETNYNHSTDKRSGDLSGALPTQTAQQSKGIVIPPPFIASYYSSGGQHSPMTDALPTLPTNDRHGVVVPSPFIYSSYTRPHGIGAAVSGMESPLPTIPAMAVHHVVTPPPFIVNMQAHNRPTAMSEPLDTLLTGYHKYVAMPETVDIEDCGFRMFEPDECKVGMGFRRDYKLYGGKRDQVKMSGNAVTPPPARWLIEAVRDSLV